MLIKIKAKFIKGDKVSPLVLRRLYNKSGHESSSNEFKIKHELAKMHRETDKPERSRNPNYLSVYEVDKKDIHSRVIEFWPKGKLKLKKIEKAVV